MASLSTAKELAFLGERKVSRLSHVKHQQNAKIWLNHVSK